MPKASNVRTVTYAEGSPAALDAAIAATTATLKEEQVLSLQFAVVFDGASIAYCAMLVYIG